MTFFNYLLCPKGGLTTINIFYSTKIEGWPYSIVSVPDSVPKEEITGFEFVAQGPNIIESKI